MAKPRVMVALRDAEAVEALVRLACQLSNGMGSELTALHVVEVPMVTPLEADDEVLDHAGKELLAHAQRVAGEGFSKKITTRLLRARQAGEAIVGEVEDQGIELLIMGYHRPHTLGAVLLGTTIQYVTHHAPCRVIVQISPPPHRQVHKTTTATP